MNNDDLMTTEEVAAFLKIAKRTIYKWSQDGTLPGSKVGPVWRYKKGDMDDWVNALQRSHLQEHTKGRCK